MKKTKGSQPKQAARKVSAQKQARSLVRQDPRWSFDLKPTKWGNFETQGASLSSRSLRQAGSMVGLGTRAVDIQRKMPRLQTTISENGNVVDLLTGTDLLSTITSPEAGSSPGDLLFTQRISPSLFANSRLKQFSDLYQRYRFRRIQFLYEPVANATQSGQLLGYADFDVDNILEVNSSENLNIGAAHQGQAITQIWQPCPFDMGQLFTFTDLYTEQGSTDNADARLSIQGVFYILAASSLAGALPLGNIYVDYEIEFSIPFLSTGQSLQSRLSGGISRGYLHAYASDIITLQSSSSLGSFGPVTVEFDQASQSITWIGTQPGDIITLALQNYPNSNFATVSNAASVSAVVTGGSLNTLTNNCCDISNAALQWEFVAQITCAPIAGQTVATFTPNLSFVYINPPGTSSWIWFLEPAGSVARAGRRSKAQREIDSLTKQLADLSALVHKGLESRAPEQSAVSRLPSVPPSSATPRLSHQLEFTQLSGTRNKGIRGKVIASAGLSDSSEDEEEAEIPSVERHASGDVLRLRRAGP